MAEAAGRAQARNVLFLCTHNSARSVLAESLLGVLGHDRFRAFSAGSHPSGRVNPFAVELARSIGYPAECIRSKSWDEFAVPGAPVMDLIITVCDDAAGEACPVWPGHPATAHWGFPDPSRAEGGDDAKRAAFHRVFGDIRRRIEALVDLPEDEFAPEKLRAALARIHAAS
ncbi:MAG: arsenate reductase ArsC [Betaproteobacteria bacterium]|nr:arsenate reductase ArsC [Betaproteobacteria bacterium]